MMLVLVVMIMAIVAGVFAVLGANITHLHRQRQADRVRAVSRAMLDSAAQYARFRMTSWSKEPPDSPVELNVTELLAPKMTGSATILLTSRDADSVCLVTAAVQWGAYSSTQELELKMPETRPAQ
jgi:hypothetical protein